MLRAKASVGLHVRRAIDLDAVPEQVGGRAHQAVAQEASARSMTLVKDERRQVPLTIARDTAVLYLSVLDYPSGWQIAAPSRTFIPGAEETVAAGDGDRGVGSHAAVGAGSGPRHGPRFGAIVASVFVRASSGSGRLDLSTERSCGCSGISRAPR